MDELARSRDEVLFECRVYTRPRPVAGPLGVATSHEQLVHPDRYQEQAPSDFRYIDGSGASTARSLA